MRATDTPCPPSGEPRRSHSSDDESFTRIWQQHRGEMLNLCRRSTSQEADAEEAFSRASLLLYRKLPLYLDRVDNLRAWILRLTFNVCMTLHRENRRRGEQSLEEIEAESLGDSSLLPPSPEGDPESVYLQREMGRFLRGSIGSLPARLRETMIGHLTLDGYREIADRLAIKEANARKRMQEAREALARGLAQYRAGAAAGPPRSSPADRKTGGPKKAEAPPERVHALRPVTVTHPDGVEEEALLALHLPLAEERRHHLESSVERHPRSAKRLALARALLEQGCVEEALPHLEQGLARQPGQLAGWLDLIAVYRAQGRLVEAAGACELALAANRGPATPLFLGLQDLCLDRQSEAERSFQEAREAMADSPIPCTAMAELQIATGRPCEAAESLREALARDPDDVAALTLGVAPLRLLGLSAEARRRDARALELDGQNPLVLERTLAAKARAAGGRISPEDGAWRAVERWAGKRVAARSLLSFLRVSSGDLAGLGEMIAFVAERPRHLQARIELARLHDALGRPLAALQEIDAARTLRPASRELDLLACRVAVRAGLLHRVRQECEDLLERHGDAWDIASTAAWGLAFLGLKDRAVEISRIAVTRQPRLPAAWLEHGRVLARAGRPQEAVAAMEAGWSLLPKATRSKTRTA